MGLVIKVLCWPIVTIAAIVPAKFIWVFQVLGVAVSDWFPVDAPCLLAKLAIWLLCIVAIQVNWHSA